MSDHRVIRSSRLHLSEFQMTDAQDVYGCITPAITKFMFWEPPQSFDAYKARRQAVLESDRKSGFSFVVRRLDTMECLGITSVEDVYAASPEIGIWLKESAHGRGYGTEAVRAVMHWAAKALSKDSFTYSAAEQNIPSRRIAESLGGKIIGARTSRKYDSVVYRIEWNGPKTQIAP